MGHGSFEAEATSVLKAEAIKRSNNLNEHDGGFKVAQAAKKNSHKVLTCSSCQRTFTTSGSYGRHVRNRCKGVSNGLRGDQEEIEASKLGPLKANLDRLLGIQ